MNYNKLYNQIIDRARNRKITGYKERHHITPRSLGGSDDADNLVDLTAREHFICHYLLAKVYEYNTFEWHKMNHAFMMMKSSSKLQNRYYNSRLYEALRKNFSEVMIKIAKGRGNNRHGTKWVCNVLTNESKIVDQSDYLDHIKLGWHPGKNKEKRNCKVCNKSFIIPSSRVKSCCSLECRNIAISESAKYKQKPKPIGFVTRKKEFFNLYNTGISISDCLRKMGYDPRCGDKRKYIKEWINNGV